MFEELDGENWNPITSSENSRKVQHYGFKYNYMTGEPGEKTHPIPKILHSLRDRLKDICLKEGIIDDQYEFNQCIINNYEPGQGISAHIDNKGYGDVIGCFSIGSTTEMSFDRKKEEVNIYPEPRSLYIMSGECRSKWVHYMRGRKSDPNPKEGGKKRIKRKSKNFNYI